VEAVNVVIHGAGRTNLMKLKGEGAAVMAEHVEAAKAGASEAAGA
jgi:hypothetical protein